MVKISKFKNDEIGKFKDVFSNFMDTETWRELSSGPNIFLPLFLFADDFECGNPLGSSKGFHKITGMYVTMPFPSPGIFR